MKKTVFILMSSWLFFSCTNPTNTTTETAQTETHEHQHEEGDHHHHSDEGAIELNNGEKWAVNAEMIPFLESGSNILKEYVGNKSEDFQGLATQLKAANDQLINSCTMEGKSHDELHKWLHPHLDLVKKLSEAKDAAEGNEIIAQLNVSYETYHKYFQ